MKKHVLLPFLLATLASNAQTVLLEESFDGYAEGSGMVTNDPAHWALWDPGEDQVVSTAFAQSGTNSLSCISNNAADGGPGDLLLLLGDRTTGIYDLSWSMYIPSGKGGYFNVQHAEDVSAPLFALEVTFAGGTVTATGDNSDQTGSYPSDEWVDILLNFDLDNAGAVLFVNNEPVITWPFDTETDGTASDSQLGAIDFYSYGDGVDSGEYYIDDLSYVQQSAGIGMVENGANTARVFPNPAQNALFVTVQDPLSQQASVQLMDVTGQLVMVPTLISSRTLRFQVEGLAAGIYFVRITDGARRIVERVVKD
jgi:hypothetical protein